MRLPVRTHKRTDDVKTGCYSGAKGTKLSKISRFVQVEVLRRADGVLFVVGNTHLHFKPSEAHIKLLQTTIAARHVQNVAKQIHAEYAEWCTIRSSLSLFDL